MNADSSPGASPCSTTSPRPGAGGPEDARERSDALATVVGRAFEPPGEPDPAALTAAAPLVAELYEQLLAHLVHALPEEEP